MRRSVNVILASLLALPLVSIAAAAPTCGDDRGPWMVLPAPRFSNAREVTDIAVGGTVAPWVYATNGNEVRVSFDGGCRWTDAFSVRAGETTGSRLGDARIKAVDAAGESAYLLVEEDVGAARRTRVFRSGGGRTWRAADTGLPLYGDAGLLRVAPGDARTVYLTLEVEGAADALFASNDGGDTWQARGPVPGARALDLEVNPSDPLQVWLGADDGLYVSHDGGMTFAALDEFVGRMTGPLDVFQQDGPARVIVFTGDGFGQLSDDGGRSWARLDQPGPPDSIASGASRDAIALSAGGRVYAYSPSVLGWIDLEPPLRGIRNLHGAPGASEIYGHTARRLAIYDGRLDAALGVPDDVVEIPDVSLLDGVAPVLGRPARLVPGERTLRIDVGETRKVSYRLSLPETVTPLDLVFVVDTSSSMTQFIDEAARALAAIHNGLVASGAAVHFGLVDYRSYPTDVPPRPDTDNYVYRRVLDVGASSAQMERAIENLVAEGGGVYDAQLEALWQLATGAGKDVWPPGPSSRDVPRGHQANFRKKALPVVVHVGDEPFGREDATSDSDGVTSPQDRAARPDMPEFAEVAGALHDRDIRHVGLSLYEPATSDLRRMAEATGTFAPRGGADCDADGAVDVRGGEPLVCEVRPDQVSAGNMTPAILGLVEALRSTTDVGLEVRGGDEVVRSVTPSLHRGVVLAARRSLTFDVTFRCLPRLAGVRSVVRLQATGLVGSLPAARTTVVCGQISREAEPAPPAALFNSVPVLPPPPALRPPPPPGSPPTSAQAQGQPQPNAGFAAQEQEQPQVALAHQFDAEAELGREEELDFVSLRREEPGFALPLAGAAVLTALAYGVATRLTGAHSPAGGRRRR